MSRSPTLRALLEAHCERLAPTLARNSLEFYRCPVRRFLFYLHAAFPQVCHASQLRRDPHLLGWFRWMSEQQLSNTTRGSYLVAVRRLFQDMAAAGRAIQPDLIRTEDFPPKTLYLPRPLSPADDQRLQQELRRIDNLYSNTLLLMRATGIRIGECIRLPLDCLRQLGSDQWALHVPIGKLHTERLVPLDADVRHVLARLRELRATATPFYLAKSEGFLIPRLGTQQPLCRILERKLRQFAQQAGCSCRIVCHQLRHTYATEMLRLGVSLPALMQLLGHKDIRMTLRYTQVSQQDLQREYHTARQKTTQPHPVPMLPIPNRTTTRADLPGIRQALAATRHLLEMYRRQVGEETTRCRLRRLDRRLLAVASQLARLNTGQK